MYLSTRERSVYETLLIFLCQVGEVARYFRIQSDMCSVSGRVVSFDQCGKMYDFFTFKYVHLEV